ncbi:MAG TPA: VWA domain-containing protein [Vicinamibacteria bacterium]|nr:VWA domain-containing protein [Vicinamibacteria bacterium]
MKPSGSGAVLVAAVLSFAAARPAPSQRSSPERGDQPPVFASGAEVVLLDMVVRSKDGRLVPDLRADEVQVFEDGAPCAVRGFRLVQTEPAKGASRSAAPGAPAAAGTAVTATMASAGTPSTDGLNNVIVLVFDQLAMNGAAQSRRAALDFVGRRFPANSWFAVAKIGDGLKLLQPFTEDPSRLKLAIEQATSGVDQPRDPAVTRLGDNATREALEAAATATAMGSPGGGVVEGTVVQPAGRADAAFALALANMLRMSDVAGRYEKGRASLYRLLAVVKGLATVKGRKTLLYFSEGLNVPPDLDQLLEATVSEANRANVAVYAVDPRGLLGVDQTGRPETPLRASKLASDLVHGSGGGDSPGWEDLNVTGTALDGLRLNLQGNLRELADSTGGFLIANSNDLRPGLERVGADLRSFYEIAYVPPDPRPDGRFRSIRVTVSRPNVTVRTRRGYYALPPGAPVVLPYELPLTEALSAKPLPRDLDLRAGTLRLAGPEARTLLVVEVPMAGLTLTPDDAALRFRGRVSLLGLVKDEKGNLVSRLSHDAPVTGPLAELDAARHRASTFERVLSLPAGRFTLEVAAQDRASGRVGATRVPFEVAPSAAGLSVGSVSMVRAEQTKEPAGDEPLRVGNLRATPTLRPSFPEGTPALSLYFSLQAAPGGEPVAVELEYRRDGRAVGRSTPELPAADANGRMAYIGSFPSGKLETGRYEVWVRARQGGAEAAEAASFTIAPRPSLLEVHDSHHAVPPPAASEAASVDAAPGAAAAKPLPAAGSVAAGPLEDGPHDPHVTTPLTTILERAGVYVLGYEEKFRNVVAEELYRQWTADSLSAGEAARARTLRSDLVFVRLAGPLPWGTFRDVFEVDGQKLRDRERRLEKLFSAGGKDVWAQGEVILKESSRYNLGGAYRNINAPTLGLLFLRPENQKRLAFSRRGTRTLAGFQAVEIEFREVRSPTLVHDDWNNDVPASGHLFIDPSRGTVLRTEVAYDMETDKGARDPESWSRAVVATDYRREVSLDMWVPDNMRELCWNRQTGRVEGTARYSNYRQFAVQTEEQLADEAHSRVLPPQPPPQPKPPPELEMVEAPQPPGGVGALLKKAGEYVVRYAKEFRNVVAEEAYNQQDDSIAAQLARDPQKDYPFTRLPDRTPEKVRSQVVFAMVPGPVPWVMLRDLLELDGHVLRPAGRLAELFESSPGVALAKALPITREADRAIAGHLPRTLAVPTSALAYLHPDNVDGFVFKREETGTIEGAPAIVIAFEEHTRPTLNRDGLGRDVPIRGRFWIREADGAVLRSETTLATEGSGAESTGSGATLDARVWLKVVADFHDEPSLGIPAPTRMTESLTWSAPGGGPGGVASMLHMGPVFSGTSTAATAGGSVPGPPAHGSIEGRATYSGFRRLLSMLSASPVSR